MEPETKNIPEEVMAILQDHRRYQWTPDAIVEMLSESDLVEVEGFMGNSEIRMTGFIRFMLKFLKKKQSFRKLKERSSSISEEFFITYALFKLFQSLCNTQPRLHSSKTPAIKFGALSSYIADRLPNSFAISSSLKEKILPLGLGYDIEITEENKSKIRVPDIYGQETEERYFLTSSPLLSDKLHHANRDILQADYSPNNNLFFYVDRPSAELNILSRTLSRVQTLVPSQEIPKRDRIIIAIAWSEKEEKIAAILGNYSLSFWAKEDEWKYEVNVPAPPEIDGYVGIIYVNYLKKWITYDGHPKIYTLSSQNYEPVSVFSSPKIKKKQNSEKIYVIELSYQKLLLLAFEHSIFLLSLSSNEILTSVTDLKTSITSIVFLQKFQALFVSGFESYFSGYEIDTDGSDLVRKGKYDGHKAQIVLLGAIGPLKNTSQSFGTLASGICSIQENGIMKIFGVSDCVCYQTVHLFKNVLYKQIISVTQGVCLVGSKLHIYGIYNESTPSFPLSHKDTVPVDEIGYESFVYICSLRNQIILVTNLCVRVYDIRNGALIAVVKGIFSSSQKKHSKKQKSSHNNLGPHNPEKSMDIYSAYLFTSKEKLLLATVEGDATLLETKQFTEIQNYKFEDATRFVHFHEEFSLFTQIKNKNLVISTLFGLNSFSSENLQLEKKRELISSEKEKIQFAHVSVEHDIIVVKYEFEEILYFYAYEKGKIIGFIDFTSSKKSKENEKEQSLDENPSKGVKINSKKIINNESNHENSIDLIVGVEFWKNKNIFFVALKNEIILYTYYRSLSSLTFSHRKTIKVWPQECYIGPLITAPTFKIEKEENKVQTNSVNSVDSVCSLGSSELLFSTSISLFNKKIILTSQKVNYLCEIEVDLERLSNTEEIEDISQNSESYNPYRTCCEQNSNISKSQKPSLIIEEKTDLEFVQSYPRLSNFRNFGNFVSRCVMGNVLVTIDHFLNIFFLQTDHIEKIAGVIKCGETIPWIWDVHNYTDKEVEEISFVLNFMQNEQNMGQQFDKVTDKVKHNQEEGLQTQEKVTLGEVKTEQMLSISKLLKEKRERTENVGIFKEKKSNSLREKKMLLEKEKIEKERMENFLSQQKLMKREKPIFVEKGALQKQINETLGFLSIHHTQSILKKPIEEENPSIAILEEKLSLSIKKPKEKESEKKDMERYSEIERAKQSRNSAFSAHTNSLVPQSSFSQSMKTFEKVRNRLESQTNEKKMESPFFRKSNSPDLRGVKTLSSEFQDSLTERFGLGKKYTSKLLIESLNLQKNQSKANRNSERKGGQFPSVYK